MPHPLADARPSMRRKVDLNAYRCAPPVSDYAFSEGGTGSETGEDGGPLVILDEKKRHCHAVLFFEWSVEIEHVS
jgi:hypothetical protein